MRAGFGLGLQDMYAAIGAAARIGESNDAGSTAASFGLVIDCLCRHPAASRTAA